MIAKYTGFFFEGRNYNSRHIGHILHVQPAHCIRERVKKKHLWKICKIFRVLQQSIVS